MKFLLVLLCCSSGYRSYAQFTETQGWFFISHQQTLSKKFDLLADVQMRSSNQFHYFNTLLLRTALSYNFNKKHSAALGYAYKGDWEHEESGTDYTLENRIYQQYIYQFKYHRTEILLRARQEQRWIKEDHTNFSQRTRAFISMQIPLVADTGFTKGLYTGVQNELFMNTQHQELVNNHFFDQNRAYVSLGYRWSKNIDTELGYMYWFQKELSSDFRRNVIQLMISTNF